MNAVLYLGFNNPLKHKRGVENVILFQKEAISGNIEKYYIFFDSENVEFEYEGLKCIGIKYNLLRFFLLNKKVQDICKKYKRTIVHSHNYLMSFFLLRRTDIFTVHDGLYYLLNKRKHKLIQLFKFIEERVYKRSEKVHFISNFTKNQSLYNDKNQKDIIIMNTTPYEKLLIEKYDKVENSKYKLFTVRSIEDRARIDLLIEVAEKMKEKIIIEIAGKGPLLEKFRHEIIKKKLTNIILYGFLSDEEVVKKYMDCNVVIVPAEFGEGFGLPIIEGYLFNKPVIASNKCAIPEVIIDNKFLFENNVECICEKIQELLDKNFLEYDFSSYYNKNFSFEIILKKYKVLYNEIITREISNIYF